MIEREGKQLLLSGLACTGALVCASCASFPTIDSGGQISGGEPRLKALLEFVQTQREVTARKDSGRLAWIGYAVVVSLDELTAFSVGYLPSGKKDIPAATYSMASSAAIGRYAVISEFVVPEAASAYSNSYRLKWDAESRQWFVDWAVGRMSRAPVDEEGVKQTKLRTEDVNRTPEVPSSRSGFIWENGKWSTREEQK